MNGRSQINLGSKPRQIKASLSGGRMVRAPDSVTYIPREPGLKNHRRLMPIKCLNLCLIEYAYRNEIPVLQILRNRTSNRNEYNIIYKS